MNGRGGRTIIVLLTLAVLGVVGYFCWQLLTGVRQEFITQEVQQTNIDVNTPVPTEQEVQSWQVPLDQPRYLTIEKIGMTNARVESLGVKAGSTQMDDPANPWNAGWYNQSAKPGLAGVGVYTCHTFFGVSSGLCNNAGSLTVGSEIIVERGDGVKFKYGVVEVKTMTVPQANEYMSTLFELPNGAKQAVSIITCSGTYNPETQTSDKRTTVRAVLKTGTNG